MDMLFEYWPVFLMQEGWVISLRAFMNQGGQILWWLAAVVALCWLLIIERLLYLFWQFPRRKKEWINKWQLRRDHHSWYSRAIRDSWLSQARALLNQHLKFIKLLVMICPMLGLLGTVTGMISVFDVMANQGSSDPSLMASGISLATLPTMAGMVAALTGMFAHSRLVKTCRRHEAKLDKSLRAKNETW